MVWVKNFLIDQIEPLMPSLATHPVLMDVLFKVLGPDERYDEATGLVTRMSGEQIAIASLLSSGSSTDESMTVEAQPSTLGSAALKARQRDNPRSSAKIAGRMTEGRKLRSKQTVKEKLPKRVRSSPPRRAKRQRLGN
jgi:hypothetical protein